MRDLEDDSLLDCNADASAVTASSLLAATANNGCVL